MDWYKHDIPKYIAETDELPDAEDLAYRRMRDIYYMTEKPLPTELEVVSDWVNLDDDVVAPVLEKFFTPTPEGFVHEEWQKEIDRRKRISITNKRNGQRGGRKPKGVV